MTRYLLLSLFCLTCTASVCAQTVLYQEQFSDGTADNTWYPGFNGNTMEVINYPGNPSGDGWVGQLGNHFSGGNVGQSYSGSPEMQDFYYEAQVYIPVDEAVYYGLEFRLDTTGLTSGYQFVARFLPGGMTTERLRFRVRPSSNPGMPSVIRDWEAAEIPGGIPQVSGWHRMAVLAKDHRFWFWFDGEELSGCPITDFSSLKGAIGAYIWDSASPMFNLHIDDINITTDVVSAVHDPAPLPSKPALQQVYPHPVRTGTSITYDLPGSMYARVNVYDVHGRQIASIADGIHNAGRHVAAWTAAGHPAGIYFFRLTTQNGVVDKRFVVLR